MNAKAPEGSALRLAIAGTGAAASPARGTRPLFEALCAGRSGLAALRGFDARCFRNKVAYEIDDRPATGDAVGRATRWLCEAVAEAAADAGLGENLSGVPVLVGTGLRELRSVELRRTEGTGFPVSRLHFGHALRERFGATASYTLNNACSASLYALGMAEDLLAGHFAETVVVAGADSITTSMFGLMDKVQPGAVDRMRPFDRNRRGVLMGDGACAVVLRRNGPARAWLRGVALNCDASSLTAPDRAGISAAITQAHARGAVDPAEIDVVYAHGTGTALNDDIEALCLRKVFAGSGGEPWLTAIKSMTGHTSGSSGLLSLVMAIESLRTGCIPPILGLEDPTTEIEGLRPVMGGEIRAELRMAQVDALGFGGVNAVAIVEKPAEKAGPR